MQGGAMLAPGAFLCPFAGVASWFPHSVSASPSHLSPTLWGRGTAVARLAPTSRQRFLSLMSGRNREAISPWGESDCLGSPARICLVATRSGSIFTGPALRQAGWFLGRGFPQATVRAWENGGVGPVSPTIFEIDVASGLAPRQLLAAAKSCRFQVTRGRASRLRAGCHRLRSNLGRGCR